MRVVPCGVDGLLLEFEQRIGLSVHQRVLRWVNTIEAAGIRGVREVVPSYAALLLRYDPLIIGFSELNREVRGNAPLWGLKGRLCPDAESQGKLRYIPELYGGEAGPDLIDSAKACRLSPEQLIRTHLSTLYRVFAIGFLPGFPYLGLLPKTLSLPRLETPRKRVPKGSVAIANRQTGIYPRESPGGWRILGRTPFELFFGTEDPPTLLQTGDTVRFIAIDEAEYERIKSEVAQGNRKTFEQNWEPASV